MLVLPGFLADDRSTRPLRWFLRRLGYRASGWRVGRNLGPTDRIIDGVLERFERLSANGAPMSLVGWSLGGIYARELARRFPDAVRQVITLGSPIGRTELADRPAPIRGAVDRDLHAEPTGSLPGVRRGSCRETEPNPSRCPAPTAASVTTLRCCASSPIASPSPRGSGRPTRHPRGACESGQPAASSGATLSSVASSSPSASISRQMSGIISRQARSPKSRLPLYDISVMLSPTPSEMADRG